MSKTGRRAAYLLFFLFVGLVILTLATTWITDGPKLMAVLGELRPGPLLFALVCSALSYLGIALSFSALFELTKHRIHFATMFSITFVAATFNYVVSTAGASSLAVRSFLFKQQKVPYSTTLPLSIAQSMITNVVLALICMGGLFYLHAHPEMVGLLERQVIWGVALLLALMVAAMAVVFFNPRIRAFLLDRGVRVAGAVSRRFFRGKPSLKRLLEIRENLEASIDLLHTGWLQLLVTLFWVVMDWGFTAATLYFCFQAVEVKLTLGLVLVGFSVAFLTSTVNFVPAGLGITEMAVTGTYIHLLNVEPEKAVVATLLFRITYFLFPLAVSTALYLDTMRKAFKNQ